MLFQPLELPCGVVLKNRIAKSAMSDSLGDGFGNPTDAQIRLYERWASGGVAVSIIGEVQGTPHFAEKPGNLVVRSDSNHTDLGKLAERGSINGAQLWLQLGHAGAMAHPPISTPKGPSAIDIPGLRCSALTLDEVRSLPNEFAQTAKLAETLGFGGVQIHAAHGFLLSQFFPHCSTGETMNMGVVFTRACDSSLEVIAEVRSAVSPNFAVTLKLNSTDQLEGGFDEDDALEVISVLDGTKIDLIDISGGTYFPGAKSASDSAGRGPYFVEFAKQAQCKTNKPLMVTGGFKTQKQMSDALSGGQADVVGLARALALEPELPNRWISRQSGDPVFPRFESPPEGGITAWYTMRLTQLGEDRESSETGNLAASVRDYDERDRERVKTWNHRFQI